MSSETKAKIDMSNVDQERRDVLRKIGIGVGALVIIPQLPEKWVKPIIGQIVLPAHAQTSARPV